MHSLIFLPLIPVILWIILRSTEDAFIDIYLPILILVPVSSLFHIPHVMGFDAHDAALFPIVVAVFIKYGSQWRLRRADFWIFLFILGAGYSGGRQESTQGIRAFFESVFAVFLPYAAGRLLLVQDGMRIRFLRRLSWIVGFVAVLSIIEFFTSYNIFNAVVGKVFGQPPLNMEQHRGGFTRTQGPYTHAIYAGLMCGSILLFALWLRYRDRLTLGSKERKFLGIRRSNILVGFLLIGLVIADSRGPWIGFALGFGIWLIGRSKNVTRTAVIVTFITIIVSSGMYVYLKAYTSGVAQTEDQQNAIYRRELLDTYAQVAHDGGFFGWGENFPTVGIQTSIDNQYLLLQLTQGLIGLWIFGLLSFESCLALIGAARRANEKVEFAFILTLLGVVSGILLTLTSVALASQPRELFFLCLGWSFSLRPEQTSAAPAQIAEGQQPRFQRIFA